MLPDVVGRRPTTTVLVTVLLLAGCAGRGQPAVVEHAEGELTETVGALTAELRHTLYRDQGVVLTVQLRNDSDQPLVVQREGILLAYQGLEFALDVEDPAAPSEQTELAAGASEELAIVFVTGTRMLEPGKLRLRAVRQGDKWLEALSLEVPPMPVAAD